jgi:predicted nucleic acid-binding protein
MLLVLAHVDQAEALITGDSDLIAMDRDFRGLAVSAGQHDGPRSALLRLVG